MVIACAKRVFMLGLRTVIFDVAELSAAKAFYTKALGKAPYFDQPFYVGFDVGGYELGLRPAEDVFQPGIGGSTAYLGVSDVEATVAKLVALGAKVREEPKDVGEHIIVATVVDPFCNALGLIRNPHFAPPLTAAGAGDISGRAITIECVVPMPRAKAWDLWTTTSGITSWMVEQAKIELRPGGPYEVYFLLDKPVGLRGSETCRVLSFVDKRMLSFTWNAPPHLAKTRDQHTWVVIELSDHPEGTHLLLTHTGWPASGLASEPQWEETFKYFQRAWQMALDAFTTFATTGKRWS